MGRLRVLLVGQALTGGGAEKRFRLIAKHLFGGTADVAVLVGNRNMAHPIAVDLGWRGKLSYVRVFWRLRKLIATQPYDVVMAFGMFPNVMGALAIGAVQRKPKLVINEITRPLAQARTMPFLRRHLYAYLRRHYYPASDLLTANSIDGLAEACTLARRPVSSGLRTPNVMDLDEVRDRAGAGSEVATPPYFVCINRLDYMKRVDTIIDAWGNVRADTSIRLLIVGDGEARSTLVEQVDRLGLRDRVTFAGAVHNAMPLLAKAKGFILASDHEGFSNAVLEAMCLDVPVITSLCSSDAREMCARGAALGFDVGDSVQLARNVRDLITSSELADSLTRGATAYRARHLVPGAVDEYERLLLDCVAATSPGGTPCVD